MPAGAPRALSRLCSGCARGVWRAATLWLAVLGPVAAAAQEITGARFTGPTTHYPHGVLGDTTEYSGMTVELSSGPPVLIGFSPNTRIFEDIAPRLWDVTGDGTPELVVIETDPPQGAQLSVYGLQDGRVTKLAATPHIGQANRWLAPVAAADLDGDGHVEIAYIDRPHLAKTLRIWRYRDGALTELATAPGLTNHKIGWDFIAGGLRDCAGPPELITANANWSRIMATRFDGTTLHSHQLSAYTGPRSLTAATACE